MLGSGYGITLPDPTGPNSSDHPLVLDPVLQRSIKSVVPVYVWDNTRWAVLCADPALFSLDPEPIFQKSFFFRSKKLQIIGYMDLSIYCTKCTYFCFKCKGLNQSRPGKKSFGSFFAFAFSPVTDSYL